jgi:hypothetical protein
MSRTPWRNPAGPRRPVSVLPIVLGLLDGITIALGLAAPSIFGDRSGLGFGLALRVALFALFTAVFSVFVARYVELRVGLTRAGRQLNLLGQGALAATRLGRAARRDAVATRFRQALSASAGPCPAGFLGRLSSVPLAPLLPATSVIGAALNIA